jgi:hypothetical protein
MNGTEDIVIRSAPTGRDTLLDVYSPGCAALHPGQLSCRPSGAEQAAEKLGFLGKNGEKHSSVAKAIVDLIGFTRGLKPPSPSDAGFSAACEARIGRAVFSGG